MATAQSASIFTAQQNLETELILLESSYPGQIRWIGQNREVVYHDEDHLSSLTLRIPDGYLVSALPEVVTAVAKKTDFRDRMVEEVKHCHLEYEVLDLLVDKFRTIVENVEQEVQANEPARPDAMPSNAVHANATVVIWLHHLLNTAKRKQALSPASSKISGLTKPGYPGVLVYSGPAEDVHQHVQELKGLKWQAFQVRFESADAWSFQHGGGIVEVENMSDIVAELDSSCKTVFLEAMNIS